MSFENLLDSLEAQVVFTALETAFHLIDDSSKQFLVIIWFFEWCLIGWVGFVVVACE